MSHYHPDHQMDPHSHMSTTISPVAGPSQPRVVPGVWRKASPSSIPADAPVIEVHREAPPSYSPAQPAEHSTSDVLHEPLAPGAVEAHGELAGVPLPPPYTPSEYGPKCEDYEEYIEEEPLTLARMLFIYGFLFFPFWLVGIYIMYSPLLPTPDWEAGKTEMEKTRLLHLIRQTELKWARRCLLATCGFCAVAVLTVTL